MVPALQVWFLSQGSLQRSLCVLLDGDARSGAGRAGQHAGAGAGLAGDSGDHPDTAEAGRVYGAL